MIAIVGLGNPGEKYQKTRHNLGFKVIDCLAEDFTVELKEEKKFKAELAKIDEGEGALLIKPLTYMNNSGEAVRKIIDYYKISESEIWVIYDDLDIEIGKLRIRRGGSSAGQKGAQSVIDHLGTSEFIRFRIGIKPVQGTKKAAEDFVLSKFTSAEQILINEVVESTAATIKDSISSNKPLDITTK